MRTEICSTYEDIFAQRGESYHAAMMACPGARRSEFEAAIKYLDLHSDQVLCDMPAGGGYLQQFITDKGIQFRCLETCECFADHCPVNDFSVTSLCDFESLPLAPESVDRALSLAALHHVAHPARFFTEIGRVLKPRSRFVLADVAQGSRPDAFLNTFVDRCNSLGHRGSFLCAATLDALTRSGFVIESVVDEQFSWDFESEGVMVNFARDLFGLDLASNQDILEGIAHHLGYCNRPGVTRMNWELRYISARPRRQLEV